MGFGGFRKYQKCAQQMAAYRLALAERTGYKCDVASNHCLDTRDIAGYIY